MYPTKVELAEAEDRVYDLAVFDSCLEALPDVVLPAPKTPPATPVDNGDDSNNSLVSITTGADDPEYDEAVRCARKYIARVDGCSAGQGRKKRAFNVSCITWNDFGLTAEDSMTLNSEWNQGNNSPPLPEQTLRDILNNAKKYAKGERGSKRRKIKKQPVDDGPLQLEQDPNATAKYVADIKSGKITTESFPLPLLSKVTRALQARAVTVFVGAPGSGKSWMVLQCLAHWIDIDVPFACMMLEDSQGYHGLRALAQRSGLPELMDLDWIESNPSQFDQIHNEHKDFMAKLQKQMWTPKTQPTPDQIATWTEEQAKAGKRIIVADPISVAKQGQAVWLEDKDFLQRVGRISTNHNISVVLTTHPKTGLNKQPSIDGIAGGAAYNRACQTIFWLESHEAIDRRVLTIDDEDGECETTRTLNVLKSRNGNAAGLRFALSFTEGLSFVEEGILYEKTDDVTYKNRRSA
jgi:hypothetical protein